MPSSNKTLHLQLNKWLGSDKPKKDDFNNDNQKVDDACRNFSQSISDLDNAQKNFATTQSVTNVSNSVTSLSGTVTSLSNTVTSHAGNNTMHVTAAERASWSKSADHVVGSYIGNGAATQKITLGYQPQFVLIFAVGDGITRVAWSSEQLNVNSGCISKLGSSKGLTLNADGFTVEYSSGGGLDGFSVKYNTSGVTYVYFLWK